MRNCYTGSLPSQQSKQDNETLNDGHQRELEDNKRTEGTILTITFFHGKLWKKL